MTAAQSETRAVSRVLAYTRDRFLPDIVNQAYNHSPLSAMLFGRLLEDMFRDRPMSGRGRMIVDGGESIVQRVRLGKSTNRKNLTGPFDTLNTAAQHHVRFARANWKFAAEAITLSKHDLGVNRGVEALSSIVRDHTADAVNALVEDKTQQAYENSGDTTAINDLDSLISANDTVHGLSGATYTDWNSRGLSARGTAPGSIVFAGGSFATTGLSNWRIADNNGTEGVIKPQVLLTTWDILAYYEGLLQAQERHTNTTAADGGFTNLMFRSKPVFADALCPSGYTYFLNFDYLQAIILSGFDFTVGDFIEAEQQPVQTAKVLFTGELCVKGRKFQNKITGQTA
jgi:hypothetical protein